VHLSVDGRELTREMREKRGAASVVRAPAAGLDPGTHRVQVKWTEEGAARESTWTFTVGERALRGRLPIRDDFSARTLDPKRWAVVDEVVWDFHGKEKAPARGSAAVEKGELHLRSTGGPFGVVLAGVEAPARFTVEWTARLPRAGTLVVQRNELLRRVPVPAGKHRIVLAETPAGQAFSVDGKEVVRLEPPIDHRGGAIGLGVAAGDEAWLDDVRLTAQR
jgi:hypothetical protein